ncbi:hypothetical protein HK104_002821 [Borealophlyctis nickersoniae]|nr:hypothetical protein HK104_002821 [Borealophlyctis nickersoniae]
MDASVNLRANEFDYVDEVNTNLICCVCYGPFVAPVSAPCGHTFCKDCIEAALAAADRPTCPVDRSPLSSADLSPAINIIHNLVNELQVYCLHRVMGCTWKGERQQLGGHLLNECRCVNVKCALPRCGVSVPRGELEAHMRRCEYRTVECSMCNEKMCSNQLENHSKECTAELVECPHCHKSLSGTHLSSHLTTCPQFPVECLHASQGCQWKGLRTDRDTLHTPSCPYEALKGFFAQYEKRYDKVIQENRYLHHQIDTLQEEIRALKTMHVASGDHRGHIEELTRLVGGMNDRTGQLTQLVGTLNERTDGLTEDFLHIRSDLVNISAGLGALEIKQDMALMTESTRLREEMQSVRALCQAVQMQLVSYAFDRRKELSSSQTSSVKGLGGAAAAVAGAIGAIGAATAGSGSGSGNGTGSETGRGSGTGSSAVGAPNLRRHSSAVETTGTQLYPRSPQGRADANTKL